MLLGLPMPLSLVEPQSSLPRLADLVEAACLLERDSHNIQRTAVRLYEPPRSILAKIQRPQPLRSMPGRKLDCNEQQSEGGCRQGGYDGDDMDCSEDEDDDMPPLFCGSQDVSKMNAVVSSGSGEVVILE